MATPQVYIVLTVLSFRRDYKPKQYMYSMNWNPMTCYNPPEPSTMQQVAPA